ncbi:hypothetical protein WN51_00109 [Melipona quadrifasciata]|uniref:Uncharacterized protein n=1 Tax=Melipona quadrifasciata TaxID=166423 RepID=A0A0N0U816_9HYME|nr:hypothetical protein WN51_00109 [Melipona quadrifasciata]
MLTARDETCNEASSVTPPRDRSGEGEEGVGKREGRKEGKVGGRDGERQREK